MVSSGLGFLSESGWGTLLVPKEVVELKVSWSPDNFLRRLKLELIFSSDFGVGVESKNCADGRSSNSKK